MGPLKDLIPQREAAELLPGNVAVSTLNRWQRIGIRGVRLKSTMVGGRRYTSAAWLEEFFDAVQEASRTNQNRREHKKVTNLEPQLRQEGLLD